MQLNREQLINIIRMMQNSTTERLEMFDQIEKLKTEIVILNRIIKRLQKRNMNEKIARHYRTYN